MASAVDSRLAYARLSAVATASRLPTANRGSNNSYTTSWDTTFDAGAFTLSPKYTVITAPAAVGPGRDQSLEQFSRCSIVLPEKTEDYPDWKSLKWHHREVFGPIIEGIDY